MGLYTMGFSVAVAIGPWLGTQILEHYGAAAVWVGTLVCGFLTALMFWFMPGRSETSPGVETPKVDP